MKRRGAVQKKLSDAYLRGLKAPRSSRLDIADLACSGLWFRVTAAGARSFNFRFRDPVTRRTSRITIGSYPAVGLGGAREIADAYRRAVARGENPAAEKRKARDEAATKTFGALAARYMNEHAKRRKRSWPADERNLRLHVLPRWRTRAYASITRADVIELLEGIVSDGKLTLVNRVQSLISKMFAFAIDAGLMTASPCSRLARRCKERKRKRVLSDPEIRLFWQQAIEAPLSYRSGQALRLALLTGVRVSEVAGIARDELENVQDPAAATWIIPGERTKNGLPHAIPLAPLARGIVLEMLGQLDRGKRFLFPARSRAECSTRGQSLSNAMLRLGDELAGNGEAVRTWRIDPPTAHDLRRTFATRMASLGIQKEIRDRLLNHAPDRSDVEAGHYNIHDYRCEKRQALAHWDAALTAILNDRRASVVPISTARRSAR
jgi:integrase